MGRAGLIARSEILPAIAANPDYLAQHHMEMSETGGTSRIRQLPGPWNALGRIKFVLPNVHGVYCTTRRRPHCSAESAAISVTVAYGRRSRRTGGVGVTGEDDWPADRIRAAVADGNPHLQSEPPSAGRPLLHDRGFDPEDGTVRFADDIYGHDARLDARLRARTDEGDQ